MQCLLQSAGFEQDQRRLYPNAELQRRITVRPLPTLPEEIANLQALAYMT
jgi:hypothetical protein